MKSCTYRNIVCWIPRAVGLLFVSVVAIILVAHAFSPEGLPRFWQEPVGVRVDALALLLVVTGAVAGWKSPRVASVLLLTGMRSGRWLSTACRGLRGLSTSRFLLACSM